jgi:hypothetical protein
MRLQSFYGGFVNNRRARIYVAVREAFLLFQLPTFDEMIDDVGRSNFRVRASFRLGRKGCLICLLPNDAISLRNHRRTSKFVRRDRDSGSLKCKILVRFRHGNLLSGEPSI